ncbi:E3 ubiquitin-protein ligase RNF149 [Spea bombifrons]|uniref:E3 ubiquitin-protein ligase RNF149 n=1 Tax=Spea bombifrons TaxID=233779 RepID=UPI0023490D00|nr:E3 ubiquitin-protein ligase RNF149 [Spea bombifrons]
MRMLGWLCVCSVLCAFCPAIPVHSLEWFTAVVRTEYTEPLTNVTVLNTTESGSYGDHSPKDSVQGLVGFPRDPEHLEGCHPDTEFTVPGMAPGSTEAEDAQPWIALVARGGCTFKEKVFLAARRRASAVVIFNDLKSGNATVPMSHLGTGNTVVIMVWYAKGLEILEPLRRQIPVKMSISVGTRHVQEISGQSVVFVAIAFITMMIISLAWLIFYYVQRFLYTGAQFGNQANRKETKKAIGQLQLHRVKKVEKGIDIDAENCAVCIENYKPKDVVRILPCNHVFHRQCIEPWLLEHRTCPMCKLDFMKALGFWVDPEETLEVPAPESMAGSSLSVGTLSIAQDDNRSEINNLPSYSTEDSLPHCNSAKDDAGETTALLDDPCVEDIPEEQLRPSGSHTPH